VRTKKDRRKKQMVNKPITVVAESEAFDAGALRSWVRIPPGSLKYFCVFLCLCLASGKTTSLRRLLGNV